MPPPAGHLRARPPLRSARCSRPTRTCWPSTSAPAARRWPSWRPPAASWPTPSRRSDIDLTEDGGAEQSPQAWWDAIVASARRALADSGVSPGRRRRRRLHRPVVGHRARRRHRDGHRPGHHLDGLAGRRAVRETVRGALNVQGYGASKAGEMGAAHRGHPEPLGQGPGRAHPFPARAAARRLRRHRGLPRTGRLSQPAPHRAGPGLARHHHPALGHRQPRHQRDRLRRHADRSGRPGAFQAARPGADGKRARRADPGRRRRARPAGGHTGHRRHGRPALGRGRVGGRGRLRRPPLHRHLELGQLPRPVQEDGRPDQHRLDPVGYPGPLPGGRRARDGWGLPDLAARQPALCRRRALQGRLRCRRRRRRRHTAGQLLRRPQRRGVGGPGRLARRAVHAVAER